MLAIIPRNFRTLFVLQWGLSQLLVGHSRLEPDIEDGLGRASACGAFGSLGFGFWMFWRWKHRGEKIGLLCNSQFKTVEHVLAQPSPVVMAQNFQVCKDSRFFNFLACKDLDHLCSKLQTATVQIIDTAFRTVKTCSPAQESLLSWAQQRIWFVKTRVRCSYRWWENKLGPSPSHDAV